MRTKRVNNVSVFAISFSQHTVSLTLTLYQLRLCCSLFRAGAGSLCEDIASQIWRGISPIMVTTSPISLAGMADVMGNIHAYIRQQESDEQLTTQRHNLYGMTSS